MLKPVESVSEPALDVFATTQPSAGIALPALWALGGSVLIHLLGFSGVQNLNTLTLDALPSNQAALGAAVIPVQMVDAPNNMVAVANIAPPAAVLANAMTVQAMNSSAPVQKLKALPLKNAIVETVAVPLPELKAIANEVTQPADKSTAEVATIKPDVVAINTEPALASPVLPPAALAPQIKLLDKNSDKPLEPLSPAPLPLVQPAPATTAPTLAPIAIPAPVLQTKQPVVTAQDSIGAYRLPKLVKASYRAVYQGIPARSTLFWQTKADAQGANYEAQLVSTAMGAEHRYASRGRLADTGITPSWAEEKRPFKSAIAINIEPQNNRAIISSQTGFLPYTAGGQDALGMFLQLGVYVQSQPQWQRAGTAHDFVVYRPNGIKHWRIQSQGIQTVEIAGKQVSTVYLRRIPTDGQADYEDQYHLWLDPAHYGFPVKIRIVGNGDKVTEITMTDWVEEL